MKIRKEPESVWREYEKGVSYNNALDLYATVEKNENFYNDKQWEGLNAPDLDKPVFNFLKPVVNYYVAQLVSDDISCTLEKFGGGDEEIEKAISQEIDSVIERCNIKFLNRKVIRNAAVDGDACLYFYFDPGIENGKENPGEICAEIVENTNVIFGNPSDERVEAQPYILIVFRRLVSEVKDEAEKNGCDPEAIRADGGQEYFMNADKDVDNNYVTVVLKLWREGGTIRFLKATKDAFVKKETDTGYNRYPISYMSWEAVKNSYHGVSPITGKIQNQIFVNKLYAMAMEYTKKMAFPKVLYDRTKIPDGWNNRVGAAVGVVGNPSEAFFSQFAATGMNADVLNMIASTISQSKELMGASDAALGNINPDNTSAIIATQQAASAPLNMQKLDFYNFVESYIRIIIDIMRVNYGVRTVFTETPEGKQAVSFDWSQINEYSMNLNIEVGAASYWSELMQISTLDNLMQMGIIPSAKLYLEAVPDGYIKNKDKIIEGIEQMEAQQEQAAMMESEAAMAQGAPQDMEAMPAPEAQMPEETPPPAEGQLGDEEVLQLAEELSQLSAEQQSEAIAAMELPQEEKDRIVSAVAMVAQAGGTSM